ncbi:hypothetical protein [Nocardia asteroides]|nr:hypothetical protein [Nocardia asteroides]UGT57615.1 hypothetical protein LTT85_12570 [Nocardia asteroides]
MQVVLAELFPGVVDAADGTFGTLPAALVGRHRRDEGERRARGNRAWS